MVMSPSNRTTTPITAKHLVWLTLRQIWTT